MADFPPLVNLFVLSIALIWDKGQRVCTFSSLSYTSSNGRSTSFSNKVGINFSMAQFPAKQKAKWNRKIRLLYMYASQFRVKLFTTGSWFPTRQWFLEAAMPKKPEPSTYLEQCVSTRATLAPRWHWQHLEWSDCHNCSVVGTGGGSIKWMETKMLINIQNTPTV